jgi:hypothetical protein
VQEKSASDEFIATSNEDCSYRAEDLTVADVTNVRQAVYREKKTKQVGKLPRNLTETIETFKNTLHERAEYH